MNSIAAFIVPLALALIALQAVRKIFPISLQLVWSGGIVLVVLMAVALLSRGPNGHWSPGIFGFLLAGLPYFAIWWWRRSEPARARRAERGARAAVAARRRVPPNPGAGP